MTFGSILGCKNVLTKPTNENLTKENMTTTKSIYDFTLKSIDGKDISLAQYKGKKILLVNVASECGYTPQYKQLQELYDKNKETLVILGFPANNFGAQEPGQNSEIKTFCEKNYGVTFQLFSKKSVKGDDQHELYKWLSTKSENGWNDKAPSWNFCKYLINEKGELINFFSSNVNPVGEEISNALKK